MDIRVKRAYDDPAKNDGFRVLVDRIWPRGIRKEDAQLDDWMRDIAPSNDLRKWYAHDPARWPRFVEKYFEELDHRPDLVRSLLRHGRNERVTLIFGARDRERNNAVALRRYLQEQ